MSQPKSTLQQPGSVISSEDKPGGQNVARPFSVSNTHPNRFPSRTDDSFDIMNVVNPTQIRTMLGFKSRAAVSNLLQGYSGKKIIMSIWE